MSISENTTWSIRKRFSDGYVSMRYYDSKGKEYFLDEGMFLCNFDKKGTVNFDVRFIAKSGTKNLDLYVSKDPFSRANLKTKLKNFKVNNSNTSYTSVTLVTGSSYRITVEDIDANDQLSIFIIIVKNYLFDLILIMC